MPTEALITELESLRDSYNQRQRAATGLMAALKGATGALTKAGRALGEYQNDTSVDAARLTQARETFEASRLKDDAADPLLPELRREVKAVGDVLAALKDALAALRGEAVDVVKLSRAHKSLQASKLQDGALSALLPRLERELDLAQQALGNIFGVALRHALEAQGLAVAGTPPRFEIGRFDIAADFGSRSASISYGKNVVAPKVSLSVEAVITAYQREAKAIMGRNEEGTRWIELFHTAWENAQRKRPNAAGRANIVDCFYELSLLRQSKAFRIAPSKHSFSDYSRAQFAHDFYLFAQQQRLSHEGLHIAAHPAAKSQAESAEKSIYIVQGRGPHDGQYIGDVEFAT